MLLRNVNVSPADRVLQPGPESLDGIDVTAAPHILAGAVIDNGVLVTGSLQVEVGAKIIRVDGGSRNHILADQGLQGASLYVRNHLGHNVATALRNAENHCFVLPIAVAPTLDATADAGFVHLDNAVQRAFPINFRHVLADFVRHPPGCLVRHL